MMCKPCSRRHVTMIHHFMARIYNKDRGSIIVELWDRRFLVSLLSFTFAICQILLQCTRAVVVFFFNRTFMLKIEGASLGGSISLWFFKNEQFRLQWFICWIPITDLKGWSFDTHPGLGGNRSALPPKVCNFDSPLASQAWSRVLGWSFMDVDVFNWNVVILLLCNYVELLHMIYNIHCAYSLYII